MAEPLVTIITPTTGTSYLKQAIDAVAAQNYPNIQHLVVVDGAEREAAVAAILKEANGRYVDLMVLPYATGKDRFNGHRIYGAASYLAKGDFVSFLDEDNWPDPTHVASLIGCFTGDIKWAFSLRKIIDQSGEFVCNDDCESLGLWQSCIGDHLVDTSCFMLPKLVAVNVSPVWFRRAREPGLLDPDRAITQMLLGNRVPGKTTGQYTLNYRAGSTGLSVRPEFFLSGNAHMKEKFPQGMPWAAA